MEEPSQCAQSRVGAVSQRGIPLDLAGTYIWTICTLMAVYIPVLSATPLRLLFGLPLVLFVPGYALIAALFPRKGDLDGIERVALSFGLSIAVVPLIGLGLNYTPFGIRLDPILASLVAFTVAMAAVAQYRRHLLGPEERYEVSSGAMLAAMRDGFGGKGGTRTDRVLSVVLVASVVVAIGTLTYVVLVPREGEHFTEFYILGEGGKATGYPTAFSAGTPQKVIIGIGNHEYRTVNYTVETYLLESRFDERTNLTTMEDSRRLDRFSLAVPHNATEERLYTFTAPDPRYNRIEFLLFNESVPDGAMPLAERLNSSYRDLHLWIDVT
ncbi:MAG: DUF1616 domain-containing protein [Methanomicrobiales archaeon]|nr:DUF1616 domain-containing protein [Methanomicrobiales archaeon]